MNRPEAVDLLIRCDGHHAIGLGHVYRCLAIAQQLEQQWGLNVAIAVLEGELAVQVLHQNAQHVLQCTNRIAEVQWLDNLIAQHHPKGILFDIRTDLGPEPLERWSHAGVKTAVLDDGSDRRLGADLSFCVPVPQTLTLDWSKARGVALVGWEWVCLRPGFEACGRPAKSSNNVFVALGGSDPSLGTIKVLEGLALCERQLHVTVLLGAGFRDDEPLEHLLDKSKHVIQVYRNVAHPAHLMEAADLAVVSFGMTAFELAAMGIPAALVAWTAGHDLAAQALVDQGAACNLGLVANLEPKQLAQTVDALLDSDSKRARMSRAATAFIDGKGAYRVAGRMAQLCALENPKGPLNA